MERSGAKWSGEVGDLLLARGLCSFGFLLVAPPPREIDREGGGGGNESGEEEEMATASQYKYA